MALTKVSIIEDDEEFAGALATILNGTPGYRCVSIHSNGEDALKDMPVDEVDILLTDLSLPGIGGAECIRRLREKSPKLLCMVLTVHEDAGKIFDSLKAGATGYLLKKTPPAQILEGIANLLQGGAPMSPAIARKVAQFFHDLPSPSEDIHQLTDREREILHYIAQNYADKEIAEKMDISHHTVRNHVKSIYAKLEVNSRMAAAAKYLRR
jgi:DNA-binding NarL/FixJ family response regulator